MQMRTILTLAACLAGSGCASSRPTYTEAPASLTAQPAVTVIIFQPTCTDWYVHTAPAPAACDAPCCRAAREVKPRWFE